MGTYIAQREKTPTVPDTETDASTLKYKLMYYARTLKVSQHLRSYTMGLNAIRDVNLKGANYYLLELSITGKPNLNITGYRSSQLQKALQDTRIAEKKEGFDVVLVSVGSLTSLRRAYPNYYADTDVFLKTVGEATA